MTRQQQEEYITEKIKLLPDHVVERICHIIMILL